MLPRTSPGQDRILADDIVFQALIRAKDNSPGQSSIARVALGYREQNSAPSPPFRQWRGGLGWGGASANSYGRRFRPAQGQPEKCRPGPAIARPSLATRHCFPTVPLSARLAPRASPPGRAAEPWEAKWDGHFKATGDEPNYGLPPLCSIYAELCKK